MHQWQVHMCFLRGPQRWLTEQKYTKFVRSLKNAQRDTTNLAIICTRLFGTFDVHLNRAVYTRENKSRLTLAAAYIRRERNHLYEYGLYYTRTARINGSRLTSRPGCTFNKRRFKIKIGELTLAEVTQTSSCPGISSSLHMSRICFSSGALHTFLILHESLSAIFHFVNVNKTHFPATATRVSRPWRSGI